MKWVFFNLFVLGVIALDLGFLNRRDGRLSVKNALTLTALWVVMAMAFNYGIYLHRGPDKALEFLTGYLMEKSLSIDNVFVFVMIFTYFKIPNHLQHRILVCGIIGALIMRATFIFAGIKLVESFGWIFYVFGALLVVTAIKMMVMGESNDLTQNPVMRLATRYFRVTHELHGSKFIVKIGKGWYLTPIALALLMIEVSDVIFAIDSIPAIFAVTVDPYIVYTANVFAILGLRSLYFVLAGMAEEFQYLKYGISAILVFVGIKMLAMDFIHIPIWATLGVIVVCFGISIAYSHWQRKHP